MRSWGGAIVLDFRVEWRGGGVAVELPLAAPRPFSQLPAGQSYPWASALTWYGETQFLRRGSSPPLPFLDHRYSGAMLQLHQTFTLYLAIAAGTSLAGAQSVFVVDPSGAGDFPSIQAGVLSAANGDTLLVRSGSYGPVTVTGKGLSIVADRDAAVIVQGGVQLSNTLLSHQIHLSGLRLMGNYSPEGGTEHGLRADVVRGPLRVQDCNLLGAQGQGYTDTNDHGGDGARLTNVLDAAFVRCSLLAGDGGSSFDGTAFLQRSGHGLWAEGGRVVLQGCELVAGDSMEFDISTCDFGGQQGHGAYVLNATLYASGTHMEGGRGGTEGFCSVTFSGGDGLRAEGKASATVLDCELVGGPNNACNAGEGQPSVALDGATISFLSGAARSIQIPSPSRSGDQEVLRVEAEPLDFAWLLVSFHPGFRNLTPAFSGPLLVGTPLAAPRRVLGAVPASGILQVPIGAPTPFPGALSLDLHCQLFVVDASGAVRLGDAQRWTTFDPSL